MPYYLKTTELDLVPITAPTDIRSDDGHLMVSIFPEEDEHVKIAIPDTEPVVVSTDRNDRLFPGQERVFNRDDIFIQETYTGRIRAIIYTKLPIVF